MPAFSGTVTKAVTLHYWNSSTSNSEDVDWTVALYLKGADNAFAAYANTSNAVLTGRSSGILTIFRCSSQVHAINYSYVGGQAMLQDSRLTNSTVTNLILSAMFPEMIEGHAGFGNDLLEEGISAIAASTKSVDHLGNASALIFSQTAMASTAGIMAPVAIEGNLVSKLVTIMPKAAFCHLCFANIALAVLALVLGIVAIILSCTRAGVADVQARLSILALTARAFGAPHQNHPVTNVKQLFHEDAPTTAKKIRIVRTNEGGWSWIAA
ncbi:hypothetical protein W97_08046 [Coniosporium apollinis CBS 100218]|uniref:Uncharacterized protein n=1 Tax=Coniosporium apollinis (strain CBS 100218) TaxID=1168221 RepID=R7Z3V9_CONA1|nr:uncharacterized protein W97_08046 [Coniosporium apollinis CBS 100218]EON68788.1 hypothetical protein W97_08046 [Coniosporium apollinis CBS 100218]